jgi:hypothetical protein
MTTSTTTAEAISQDRGPVILVIEDDPSLDSTPCHSLRLENYPSLSATDGEAGLRDVSAFRRLDRPCRAGSYAAGIDWASATAKHSTRFVDPRTVDIHVSWPRGKFRNAGLGPNPIQTVHGSGYRYSATNLAARSQHLELLRARGGDVQVGRVTHLAIRQSEENRS